MVFTKFRIRGKKDSIDDVTRAKEFLFTPARRVSFHSPAELMTTESNEGEGGAENRLQTQIETQKQTFLTTCHLTQRQINLVVRALTYLGDYCAKTSVYRPLLIAWDKLMEMGVVPAKQALSTYLYVLSSSTTEDGGEEEGEYNAKAIPEEVAILHDILHQPTENTITLRIKGLVEKGDAEAAEALIRTFPTSTNTPLPTTTDNSIPTSKRSKKKAQDTILKLRTCLPVLDLYCRQSNIAAALNLYVLMRKSPSVYLDAACYTMFLAAVASNGYLHPSCSSSGGIEGAEGLGYGPGYGPLLLDRLMGDMAEDVLEISGECARRIRNGISRGFVVEGEDDDNDDGYTGGGLGVVPRDCTLSPVVPSSSARGGDVIANRVSINQKSAICSYTNTKLRLMTLDTSQQHHIRDTLVRMAVEQFEAFGAKLESRLEKNKHLQRKLLLLEQQEQEEEESTKGKEQQQQRGKGSSGGGVVGKRKEEECEEDFAGEELKKFMGWLDGREGMPFTAIVDGANVAYHRTGIINYHLIRVMVQTLESMGETVLVIMPQKYAQKKFHLRKQHVQELNQSQMDIIERLTSNGQLYLVPAGCLDDYYWMIASVADQTSSRMRLGGGDEDDDITTTLPSLDVAPGNEGGRWPGARPSLISNDQMRDHRLELLEPRLFRRWASTHIVNYHFPNIGSIGHDGADIDDTPGNSNGTSITEDGGQDGDVIRFSQADFFSHEIQGNRPMAALQDDGDGIQSNDDDVDDDGDSLVWHIPVSDWDRNDRFCIKIPNIV